MKNLSFYAIDASTVARNVGMAGRINTIMQTCYFAISGVLPKDEAIAQIKKAIKKTYGKRGDAVVHEELRGRGQHLGEPHPGDLSGRADVGHPTPGRPGRRPGFRQAGHRLMLAGKGDLLPVSAFPVDGTWPTGTTQWEKRNIAEKIRSGKWTSASSATNARSSARTRDPAEDLRAGRARWRAAHLQVHRVQGARLPGMLYTLQVAAEDCTGCQLCVQVCPAKDKSTPAARRSTCARSPAARNRARKLLVLHEVAGSRPRDAQGRREPTQFMKPLFEFSGACAGCGETPYVKLLTQLFGDRLLIANATGCSSIYGGNLPTTPYTIDGCGRGPAWANSLFEDNAEFGLGMRAAATNREPLPKSCSGARPGCWVTISSPPSSPPINPRKPASTPSATGFPPCARRWRARPRGSPHARPHRRLPGRQERLDSRRRRLGLRHRVRRSRPRHRFRPQRQYPGARHRGLLQHRRPAVQGHAARRGCEIQHGRQGGAEEGPRADRGELRFGVCRPDRPRRQGRPRRQP